MTSTRNTAKPVVQIVMKNTIEISLSADDILTNPAYEEHKKKLAIILCETYDLSRKISATTKMPIYAQFSEEPYRELSFSERKDGSLIVDFFNPSRLLGAGGFSEVFLVLRTIVISPTNELNAIEAKAVIKIPNNTYEKQQHIKDDFEREIRMLNIAHPKKAQSEENAIAHARGNLALRLHKKNGRPLHDWLHDENLNQQLTWDVKFKIACELLTKIQKLHSKNLVHRDIKPDNTMLDIADRKITVKLIDYNLCISKNHVNASSSFNGTIGWCAPQAFIRTNRDESIDNFSAGLILLILLFDKPFPAARIYAELSCAHRNKARFLDTDSFLSELEGIIKDHINSIPSIEHQPQLKTIISNLLQVSKEKRWKLEKALAGMQNLLKDYLKVVDFSERNFQRLSRGAKKSLKDYLLLAYKSDQPLYATFGGERCQLIPVKAGQSANVKKFDIIPSTPNTDLSSNTIYEYLGEITIVDNTSIQINYKNAHHFFYNILTNGKLPKEPFQIFINDVKKAINDYETESKSAINCIYFFRTTADKSKRADNITSLRNILDKANADANCTTERVAKEIRDYLDKMDRGMLNGSLLRSKVQRAINPYAPEKNMAKDILTPFALQLGRR